MLDKMITKILCKSCNNFECYEFKENSRKLFCGLKLNINAIYFCLSLFSFCLSFIGY